MCLACLTASRNEFLARIASLDTIIRLIELITIRTRRASLSGRVESVTVIAIAGIPVACAVYTGNTHCVARVSLLRVFASVAGIVALGRDKVSLARLAASTDEFRSCVARLGTIIRLIKLVPIRARCTNLARGVENVAINAVASVTGTRTMYAVNTRSLTRVRPLIIFAGFACIIAFR